MIKVEVRPPATRRRKPTLDKLIGQKVQVITARLLTLNGRPMNYFAGILEYYGDTFTVADRDVRLSFDLTERIKIRDNLIHLG